MSEEMSDLVALFVLGMCTFYSVWLSMEFSPRSKLHLLWTIPVGFFGCFAALAIFSLVVNQADDFLFIAAASALFLPFPIWRLYNRRKLAPVPKEQAAPKEPKQILTPSALFGNMKSKLDLQTALLKKNNGDDLPPPEVSGSKYINPNDPKLKQHYEPFKGWRSDFKKEMGFDNDDFDDDDFDDDDFDDDDEEFAQLPKGLKIGDIISFDYTNGKGEFSERTIILIRYYGDYIDGYDLKKEGERTFRTDRIDDGVTNTTTGEVFYL